MYDSELPGGEKKSRFAWIPGIIRRDILRKIIALFFAVLVYFMVSIRLGTESRIANVPVDIDLPASLVNLQETPPQVAVIVRGGKKALEQLTASDIKIKATVQESKYVPASPYTLRLNPDNVQLPFGVTAVSIDKAELSLPLDRKISKQVQVRASFNAEKRLPPDYAVKSVKFNPAEVWVTGAESLVGKVSFVLCRPIPLDVQTVDSFEYSAVIDDPPFLTVSPNRISTMVEIGREYTSQTFKAIPIKLLEPAGRGAVQKVELVSSPHVEVIVSGPTGKIAALKPDMIKAYVDISAFQDTGSYSADVDCWVTVPGVRVQSVYPNKISLNILSRGK